MLISVNGTIIDTKDIYRITEIYGNNCWDNEKYGLENKKLSHSAYAFEIELCSNYKNKTLSFYLSGDDVFSDNYWYGVYRENYQEYLNRLEKIKKKLSNFRDSIVKIWQENQSEIPQFNL